MRLYARIALLLGGFLVVAGLVYGGSNKERIGLVLLLVAGGGFAYLGLYTRRAIRVAESAPQGAPEGAAQPQTEAPHAEAPHAAEEVRPTIWPLVFSLAGALLVAGVLASHWILVAGGLLTVAAAAGWFVEVLRQRQQHH